MSATAARKLHADRDARKRATESAPKARASTMTAAHVKDALRRHHPGSDLPTGGVGEWTCIEEWLGIDLLALSAWSHGATIGYEVKVSRSDLRRELLNPWKRDQAVASTTEFYFAVPSGLLNADELAWQEPEWERTDFERTPCPGLPPMGSTWRNGAGYTGRVFSGRCEGGKWARRRGQRGHVVQVPIPPTVVVPPEGFSAERAAEWVARWPKLEEWEFVTCPTCGGKGYIERSRVEREAPTLWVPRDVGLVIVNGSGVTVVKPSPTRGDPEPIAPTRKALNDLVRWVSHRPDPRHRQAP